MANYKYTPDMKEISGFGGGYEATCREMVIAGLEWLDNNPQAKPEFSGYEGVFGIVKEDNNDAKLLTEAVVKAGGDDITGAMHHGSIRTILWIKQFGWPAYVKKMSHPDGELGIVKDKLADAQKELSALNDNYMKLREEKIRRGEIIAEKFLCWKRHPVSANNVQTMYGPSAEVVYKSHHWDLNGLIDEEIAKIGVGEV